MWLAPALTSLVVTVAVVDVAEAGTVDRQVHDELGQAAGWTHSHTDGTVQVSKKSLKTVGTTAWMGETTLPDTVSARSLFRLLEATETHASFNRTLTESVVLDRSNGVTTFYQVVRPPAYVPLSERWWVCRAVNELDADGTPGHLRRLWSSVPSHEPVAIREKLASRYPSALEIPFSHGRWDLEPLPDGSTKLTYRIVTDPGGGVPRVIASRFAGRSVADNIRTMVDAAAQK